MLDSARINQVETKFCTSCKKIQPIESFGEIEAPYAICSECRPPSNRKTKKIYFEGMGCPLCLKGVLKRKTHKDGWKPKSNQPYYFSQWFSCNRKRCSFMGMNEVDKVHLDDSEKMDANGTTTPF
jgi:hypothetical protein